MSKLSRKPILLNKNCCALIHIFDRTDEFFDVCLGIYDEHNAGEEWEEAAKEFISQLKERWSVAFMEALKKEIEDLIKK